MLIYRRVTGWNIPPPSGLAPSNLSAATTWPRSAGPRGSQHTWVVFGRFRNTETRYMESPERARNEEFGYSIWNELNFKKHNNHRKSANVMDLQQKLSFQAIIPTFQRGKHRVFCTVFSHHRRLRKTQRSGTSGACTDFKFHVIHNGARRRVGGILLVFYRFLSTKIRIRGRVFSFCLIQREGNTYINTIISI